MMNIKNILLIAALALMGAMMTGCSSDDNFDNPQQPENKSNVVTLTTTVGFDASAGTRALTEAGVKTFAVNDQIAVVYKKKTGGATAVAVSEKLTSTDIASGSKSATFTVTLDDPDNDQEVTYIYPAAMAGETGVDLTKLNTQEGTFDALQSKYDLCTKSGAWDAGNLPSLTLENQLAILAITLKDDAATPTEITSITSLAIGDGTNTYTVSRSAAAGPIYVAIRPTTSANIDITANDGSQCYNKSLTGKTYAASNGYSVSWKMAQALISNANTVNYGMVVCAAGHLHLAKTAVPSGCTAVGILGKVRETGHGLILALQDATKQSWNTINGWTSVITYAGTTLKQLPDDAARGSLTSYTKLGSVDVSNWCVGQKSDYEPIFINLGSTVSDSDGTTYDANVNAYITTGVGGTAISGNYDGRYWSATELGNSRGWVFHSNYWSNYDKDSDFSLRPVLGF